MPRTRHHAFHFLGRTIALSLLLLAVTAPAQHAAQNTTMVVNTDTDKMDISIFDGLCSLREAITNANNDAATYPDCPAGSAADTITFADDHTITLGNQLLITSAITINGRGTANTIMQAHASSGVATHRIFEVTLLGNLTLDAVTVRNGRCTLACTSGAGIFNDGILNVNNSTIVANSAYNGGGIFNSGESVTITNSTVHNNLASGGGGIFNSGESVSITNSTIDNNDASQGGGIFNVAGSVTITNSAVDNNDASQGGGILNYSDGDVTITNSVMSSNHALDQGGGMFSNGDVTITNSAVDNNAANQGGGIFNNSDMTITSSVMSSNHASNQGGGIYNSGLMLATNSTISDNMADIGGGIFNSSVLTVANSTIALNESFYLGGIGGGMLNSGTLNYMNTIIAGSVNSIDCTTPGTIGTNIQNLVEDGSCASTYSGDPQLDTFADYGGPTKSYALLPGSPAIDKGNHANCPAVDQRGVTRPQGVGCDIGSFEVEFPKVYLPVVIRD